MATVFESFETLNLKNNIFFQNLCQLVYLHSSIIQNIQDRI
jgi:hypothetical protein